MKRLIFINGTMGVGKTATCRELLSILQPSAFLDGDWCWCMNPFQVTAETKHMVEGNICFLLRRFLSCSAYENVIFCWVMHQEAIIDSLLDHLDLTGVTVYKITLVASKEALTRRIRQAIERGERTADVLQRSLDRLPLYREDVMHTIHIDVSNISPQQAAQMIVARLGQ